jgi:spore maturation protein CgeB
VYRKVNIGEYRAAGGRHIELLMPYYTPEVHRPIVLTPDEQARYACDLVFVGHYENDGRMEYLRALVKAGLQVRLFGGKYWDAKVLGELAGYFGAISPVLDKEYAKALIGAKLCLAFLSKLNRDTYTRRSFEIPACGGVMLSERTDDLMQLYKEGEEVAFFSSPQELVETAMSLLAHRERRTQIARAGHARCVNDGHDVLSRMRQFCRALA